MSPPVVFSSSEACTMPGVDQLEVEQASCVSSSAREAEILGSTLRKDRAKLPAKLINKVRQAPNFVGVCESSLSINGLSSRLNRIPRVNCESNSPSVRSRRLKT